MKGQWLPYLTDAELEVLQNAMRAAAYACELGGVPMRQPDLMDGGTADAMARTIVNSRWMKADNAKVPA